MIRGIKSPGLDTYVRDAESRSVASLLIRSVGTGIIPGRSRCQTYERQRTLGSDMSTMG